VTNVNGLQGCGPRRNPEVTSHTPGSVRQCEGMNIHTPKATPTGMESWWALEFPKAI
jgi:hypothetical protein